ncbi:hypothetical protein [Dietzia kunjamensis]|uniref:hypothetical protein n=1 Tax=Dietzia kunjamensis TaxID=322509 RepID=UPI0012B93EC8|nr:hypothetical protein [Dietzia kunjamensis]
MATTTVVPEWFGSIGSGSAGNGGGTDPGSAEIGLAGAIGGLLEMVFGSLGVTAGSVTGSLDGIVSGDGWATGGSLAGGDGGDGGSGAGGTGSGGTGAIAFGSLGPLGSSDAAGSTGGFGSVALGSLALGGLAVGGLIYGVNTGAIRLDPAMLPPLPREIVLLLGAGTPAGRDEVAAPGPLVENGRG